MKLRESLSIIACVMLLSACGGGGGGTISPPPTPAPTPTPTPTPTPQPSALTLSASSMEFTSSGAQQQVTPSENNYSGTFTATADPSSCSNVATVSAQPAATGAFTVTSGSAAGTCTISFADSYGQKATLTVTVTLTQGTIQ